MVEDIPIVQQQLHSKGFGLPLFLINHFYRCMISGKKICEYPFKNNGGQNIVLDLSPKISVDLFFENSRSLLFES